MTLEDKLEAYLKEPGAHITPSEVSFIRDMRIHASHGVGYGFMQQLIEWEWASVTERQLGKSLAWGPEVYAKERQEMLDRIYSLEQEIWRMKGHGRVT